MPDSIAPLSNPRVALVGFGEAGEAFALAKGWRGLTFGWDILPERRAAMARAGVRTADTADAALADARPTSSPTTRKFENPRDSSSGCAAIACGPDRSSGTASPLSTGAITATST